MNNCVTFQHWEAEEELPMMPIIVTIRKNKGVQYMQLKKRTPLLPCTYTHVRNPQVKMLINDTAYKDEYQTCITTAPLKTRGKDRSQAQIPYESEIHIVENKEAPPFIAHRSRENLLF